MKIISKIRNHFDIKAINSFYVNFIKSDECKNTSKEIELIELCRTSNIQEV